MKHGTALRLLDELDARKRYGLALRLHLARCASCAGEAERLKAALLAYRGAPHGDEEAAAAALAEDRIMAALRLMPPPAQDFALRDWLFPAAVLAVSMLLLPLVGRDLGFLQSLFGQGYELSLSLVLGIALTAYMALFIATHLAELQSYLEKRGLMPR